MLQSLLSVGKSLRCLGSQRLATVGNLLKQAPFLPTTFQNVNRNYCVNTSFGRLTHSSLTPASGFSFLKLLQPKSVLTESSRTVIKFSKTKGKRKTEKVVLQKFYRLDWGCWIRGKCGRKKRLYKKTANCRRRLQYHVFCNGRQSYLLDRLVTRYWRKPRHYVDDPYEPYHSREEYKLSRLKPYQPFL